MDLRLLGPIEANAEGMSLALGGPRQRAVLAALLLKGNRPVSIQQLAQAVWDEPPASANANIRTYVAGLRRVFRDAHHGDRLTSSGAAYRFAVEPSELDVARFLQLADRGKHAIAEGDLETGSAHLNEALELWSGSPLSGAALGPWLQMEVARLEEQRLAVVEQRVDVDLAIGRHAELVTELRQLVAEHPLRERFWAQLMLALYRLDRQADALAAYEQIRTQLADELGLDPCPEVQSLHGQILRAEPALLTQASPVWSEIKLVPRRVTRPRQLPLSSVTFTGREEELKQISELLRSVGRGPVVISAIDGVGGIGKSALAVQAASQLAECFPDGQLYVDLQGATVGLSPLEPTEVLRRFLRALGMAGDTIPVSLDEMTAAFRSELAGKRLLVVLDNAANAEQVGPLLPSGRDCAALITSRRVLATLEGVSHIHLDVLPFDEAVTLLGRLVGAERVEVEHDAAMDIVQLCGRLPLALRIAGARLAARPRWSLRAFAEKLSDTQTRLDQLESGNLAVRACLLVSYTSLQGSDDPNDQMAVRAFRLVGLLDGPEVGIPVVAALMDQPKDIAETAMERLVDARLAEAEGVGRYRFHDLVRLFARELATRDELEDDAVAAIERAMSYYLSTTQRAVKLLDPLRQWPVHPVDESFAEAIHGRPEAEAWLETERINLVAAVLQTAHAQESIARFGPGFAGALFWFLMPRMYVQDQLTVGGTAIQIAKRLGDRGGEAWGAEVMAQAYFQIGLYGKQRAYLELANKIWLELGDRDGEQRTLCNLAIAERALGNYAKSIELLDRQIAMARGIGNRVAELVGKINLGESFSEMGRTAEALSHLNEAYEMAHSVGDSRSLAAAAYEIGKLYLDQGQFVEALEHMHKALPRWREIGDRENGAELMIMLGRTCRMLGHFDQALTYCEQGLAMGGRAENWYFEAEAIRERGRVLAALRGSGGGRFS